MRPLARLASASLALACVLVLPYEAMSHARVGTGDSHSLRAEPFGSACRVRVVDSDVTAHCHNPYPATDSVRLHVECARWWDLDSDAAPVEAGPAQTVRLDGRCWKEVRSAWVSHRRAR
ncbi:hypothetical protein ACGFOM_19470 [Streptomyces sp. NPDC048594]|uniref:hypothetical protein n=1 Tax=Streptomyces sp. NPDC048594 TaxID=3365575 RepID=UPI003720A51A